MAIQADYAERLVEALTNLFGRMSNWRDDDVRRFVRQAVPLVRGAQRAMAEAVASRVASNATRQLGRTVEPIAIPSAAISDLRGVSPFEVYTRPFTEMRTALAEGKPLTKAVDLARSRLAEIARADIAQSYSHANREAFQRLPKRSQPRYWRRVLQGEENCALCIVAASNRYTMAELNPIHPGCDCEVAGVWGADRWQAEDDAALERVHQAVQQLTGTSTRGGRAIDYRQLLVKTHGELGPMLVRPRDEFTGPTEVPST